MDSEGGWLIPEHLQPAVHQLIDEMNREGIVYGQPIRIPFPSIVDCEVDEPITVEAAK